MESRSSPGERRRRAEVVLFAPDGARMGAFELSDRRVTVGRLEGANDIVLEPDPELLVTRAGHCAFEHDGTSWFVVDGGGVNGTYLRRAGDTVFRAFKFDVLRVVGGRVAEITTFGAELFPAFGLAPILEG